jgi:hypothetical protein
LVDAEGDDFYLALKPGKLGRQSQVGTAGDDHGSSPSDDLPGKWAIDRAPGVRVLSHHHRRIPGSQKAGEIGQGMWMVHVDDIGALPGSGDVSWCDLL